MRCPKCETLFLAKPPVGADAAPIADDPSAMYQQINPTTRSNPVSPGPMPARPAQGSPQPGDPFRDPLRPPGGQLGGLGGGLGGGPPASATPGPITMMMRAVDVAQPPASAPTPAPTPSVMPAPPAGPPPSGLELATTTPLRPNPTRQVGSDDALPPPTRAPRAPAGIGAIAASWAALGLGGAALLAAFLFSGWARESLDLDTALMPSLERTFGVKPPLSFVDRRGPSPVELRRAAEEATARGDFPAAVVLWQRVRQRESTDARASVAVAKLRSDLGDTEAPP